MSFETSPYIVKPSTDIPANSQNGAPTAAAVASSIREAISKNNNKPSIEAGTFSVSAMEERRREQEEDKIIQEIQDKTDDILESLESTNTAKLTELENDLNIAMEERNKEIKIAQLQSIVENIELAYEESKTPTEDRFSVEIEKVGALSVKINPEVSEILHDFRADLIENINNIEIDHRVELQKLAERAESALKKLNTKTEQQAPDSNAESPRVVSDATPSAMDQQVAMVQQAIKVGKEVKAVPKIEALDLRVSKIQEGIDNLERRHAEHEEEAKKTSTTMEQLQKELAVVAEENSNLKGHMLSELRSLEGAINSRTTNHEERIDSANSEAQNLKTKIDELSKKYDDLLGQLNSRINKIYDNGKRFRGDLKYEEAEAESKEINESRKAFQSFTDLANLFDNISREQEGVSSEDVSELENLLNIFTGSYSNNKRFAEQFDSNEEMKQWRINNLPKITALLSAYKQQNDLGAGKLELSNTDAIIDPPKEGEDWSAGEWKMPSGEGVGLDDIPLAEKAAGWANNGDGNDDGLEGGVGASEPQVVELGINTNVIDGEYTTITEPQSVERTTTNPIYDQLVNLTKQPTANMEFRFDLDGKEYIINNLEDFCTYVMLQDSRLLQSGFDRTTANPKSLYSFDLNANRALKLQKIRAGQNIRMTPKEVKDLFKYSFVEYIKHLSGVISDYEKNPDLVAQNMVNVAKQQTMYDFEAVPMPAPAAAKNSLEAASPEEKVKNAGNSPVLIIRPRPLARTTDTPDTLGTSVKSRATNLALEPKQEEMFAEVEKYFPPFYKLYTEDNQLFEFSEIHYADSTGFDRDTCVMYYVSKNGTKYPTLLYKSHSDGGWRASIPDTLYHESGFMYSKGKHYSRTAKLDLEISLYLEEMENAPRNTSSAISLPEYRSKDTLLKQINEGYVKHSSDPTIAKYGDTDTLTFSKYPSLYKRYRNGGQNNGLDDNGIEDFNVDKELIPDFSRPIKMYDITHTIVGSATVLVYEKEIEGKIFEFHIANPKNGLPWLNDITERGGERTIYGTSKDVYDFGCLDMKPFDYEDQVPKDIAAFPGTEKIENYLDCRPFLVNTNFMSAYMKEVYKNGSPEEYIHKYKELSAPLTPSELLELNTEIAGVFHAANRNYGELTEEEINIIEDSVVSIDHKLLELIKQGRIDEKDFSDTLSYISSLRDMIISYLSDREVEQYRKTTENPSTGAVSEDRNPFRYIPENVDADESGTVSPAVEPPSIEAVSAGEVGPTTENEPEMGAAGAEQADSITGGAGVEEGPAHTSVFGQMPAFEVSGSEPKMTMDEINKHREDIDALIGRKWIDASHGYVLIGGQLMDLMDMGKLAPSDAAKARDPIQAAITQIEKWKDEGRIYADLNPHLKTLRDLLSGLEAIEYDTRTKEAEIAAIGAEVERFSKSPEYLEIKKISETPTPLFGSSTTDLHKRLGSIEAASDTVRDFISRLRSADPKNEFLSEMNRLSNTLDNRYLDIERGMPDRYKAEIKSIIDNTISRAKLINSSERSMSRVDAMIVELDTAQAKIEDMTARPELTNPIIRLEIIKSLQEIRREQDRMQGVKERFENIQAATDKLRSQKDEATRKMAKPASTLTPADNPDQINDELARLDRMIVTDSDYSSLEAIDPDNSILKDRDLLRSQIENYLATLGGRKAELEQLTKIETFKTEVAAIESEMKSKFDELNADMERVYAGVIADLTTIPEEDSDETPLPSDRKALLAQRWEEYRIGRMRWKHQAIKLNDQFKGRLDALRSTIYTVRVPLDICRKFADTETAINKKYQECKGDEKTNKYLPQTLKAIEVMVKRGVKHTSLQTFDQIKNGVAKDGRLKRIWKRITRSK